MPEPLYLPRVWIGSKVSDKLLPSKIRPLSAHIKLTENCQAKCISCNYWQSRWPDSIDTPRAIELINEIDAAGIRTLYESRYSPATTTLIVTGDVDEPVGRADRGIGQDLQLRAAERDQLPDGVGLLELRRYGLGVGGHLHQRGVVLSAQVRADRRVDNRRHDRQRGEDDRADGDRDPGAQAHVSVRSTYPIPRTV